MSTRGDTGEHPAVMPEPPAQGSVETEPDRPVLAAAPNAAESVKGLAPGREVAAAADAGGDEHAQDGRRPEAQTEEASSRRERVKATARGAVEERLAPRVEKLRRTSNVVLDEAADDPSLRFVLVALALFLLSLLFLFLNHLLG
jgi:hypothetical protein